MVFPSACRLIDCFFPYSTTGAAALNSSNSINALSINFMNEFCVRMLQTIFVWVMHSCLMYVLFRCDSGMSRSWFPTNFNKHRAHLKRIIEIEFYWRRWRLFINGRNCFMFANVNRLCFRKQLWDKMLNQRVCLLFQDNFYKHLAW